MHSHALSVSPPNQALCPSPGINTYTWDWHTAAEHICALLTPDINGIVIPLNVMGWDHHAQATRDELV